MRVGVTVVARPLTLLSRSSRTSIETTVRTSIETIVGTLAGTLVETAVRTTVKKVWLRGLAERSG